MNLALEASQPLGPSEPRFDKDSLGRRLSERWLQRVLADLPPEIGASGLVMVILYSVGILEIPITVLFAVVDALMVIGLVLVRAFLRSSIARLPGPLYFTVVAYILATASFVYSSSNGEAWIPFLIGIFFSIVAAAGMLLGSRIGKALPVVLL
ncbi:hypothetical protein E6H24_01250 [Candidatus Bathyarchaeota archaeon]|nr:MAG: hypothetical protein E6H24_01250 [Candidatus Bathyarchaeota archaeon]